MDVSFHFPRAPQPRLEEELEPAYNPGKGELSACFNFAELGAEDNLTAAEVSLTKDPDHPRQLLGLAAHGE